MPLFDDMMEDESSTIPTPQEQPPAPGRIFADMLEDYEVEQPPEDRGFIGDVASAVGRGTAKAVEMAGRGLQVADLDPEDDRGFLDVAGRGLQQVGEAAQELPLLKPDRAAQEGEEGFAKRTFTGAVESLPLSASPLAGAAAGATIGAAAGPIGAVTGGLIGGALPLLLSFGGGTYHEERERAKEHLKANQPHLSEKEINQKAHDFGLEKALWEVGTEAISDVVTAATFGTGKLLASMGKSGVAAAAPTIKSVLSLGPREFSKKFVKAYSVAMPAEALSEMAAYHGQAAADAGLGIGDGPALQGYLEAAATAAWMSGIMGVGVSGYTASQKERAVRNLNSSNPLVRNRAVDQVATGISSELGAGQAAGWREMARQTIEAGREFDISTPIVSAVQDIETRKTQQGVIGKALAAGGLMGAAPAVTVSTPEAVTEEQAFKAETITYNQIQQKIRSGQLLTESDQSFLKKQRKKAGLTEQERAEIETELYQRDIEVPGTKEFEGRLRRELPAVTSPETMTASEEEDFRRKSEEYTKLKGKMVSGQQLTREEEISLARLGGFVPEKDTEADRLVKEYQKSIKVPRSEYYEKPFYPEKRPSFEEQTEAAARGEQAFPVEELTDYEQFERDALEYNRLRNIPEKKRTSGEQLRFDILTNQMDVLMKQGEEKRKKRADKAEKQTGKKKQVTKVSEIKPTKKTDEGELKSIKDFTPTKVINEQHRKLKAKLGTRKFNKYREQVDRLINPNKNEIIEYRPSGVVVRKGNNYIFKALADMELKTWRIAFERNVNDQFTTSLKKKKSRVKPQIGVSSFSKNNEETAAIVSDWLSVLQGRVTTSSNILIVSLDELTSPLLPRGVQSAIKKNPGMLKGKGFAWSKDGQHVLVVEKIEGDAKSKAKRISVLAHELGHVIQRELFDNALQETQEAIIEAHLKWYNKLSPTASRGGLLKRQIFPLAYFQESDSFSKITATTTPTGQSVSEYLLSFNEWFANETSKALTTTSQPTNAVERFFKEVATVLREFAKKAMGTDFAADRVIVEFLYGKKPLGEKVLDETGDIRDIRRTLGENTPKEFQETYRSPKGMSTLTSNAAYAKILPKYTEKLISEAADIKHDLNNVTFSLADNKEHLFRLFEKRNVDSITVDFQGRSYTLLKPKRSTDRIELNRKGREVREELLEEYRKTDQLKHLPRQGRSLAIQTEAQPITRATKYGTKTLEQAAQEHLEFLVETGVLSANEAAVKNKILTEIADKLINKGLDHTFKNEEADTSFSIKRGRRKDYFIDPENAEKFDELRKKLNEATGPEAVAISKEIDKLVSPEVSKAFKSAAEDLKSDTELAKEVKGKLGTTGISPRQALGKQGKEEFQEFQERQKENLDKAFKSLAQGPLPLEQQANVVTELGSLEKQKNIKIVTPEQALKGLENVKSGEIKYSKETGRIEGLTFPDGRVWLVQGNIEKGKSLGVFAHEVGVHARQLGFKNQVDFKRILNHVERLVKLGKDDQINAARNRVPDGTKKEDITEETLAYLVSEAPQHNVVKRLIAAIKKFLVEKGWIGIDKLSPENIQAMAQAVMRVEQELIAATRPKLSISSAEQSLNNATQEVSEEDFKINRQQKGIEKTIPRQANNLLRNVKLFVDQYLGTASTRLKNKSPKVAAEFRELDRRTGAGLTRDIKEVTPFLRGLKSMPADDRLDMDYALKNGVNSKINSLNDKYNLNEQYQAALKVIERINAEKENVGYERDTGWPTTIKDIGGFLEHFDQGNMRPEFTDAIKFTANRMGITPDLLDSEIKAEVITNVILGTHLGKDRLDSDFLKIPPELNQFYMRSDEALAYYLSSSRKQIESRKFFGKVPSRISQAKKRKRLAETKLRQGGLTAQKEKDLKDRIAGYQQIIDLYKVQRDYTENIGTYINDLLIKREIKPSDEKEIKDILSARFKEKGPEGLIKAYKNLSYMDTMGSPISALTQIGDAGFVFFEAGIVKGARAVTQAMTGKSPIKYSDIPIEHISQEFADSGTLANAVSWVFKHTGLEKMDRLGKESLINAAFEKYKKSAKENPEELKKRIEPIFRGETDSVIQDLLNNDVTDNVKVLVYHRLLDFQPVAMSEMPEKYLTAGNGRIFYMLKSFTLKQFDVYRREIYQKAAKGNRQDKIDAIKNVLKLAMFLGLANAGADEIKDFVLGRETDLEDRVVDNILRLFGISKFITWQARREGIGTAIAKQILPPFKFIDAVTKDIVSAGDDKGLRTPASIPLVGKFAYWHLGRGADSKGQLWDIRWRKEKKRLEKVQDRLERASNKKAFISSNKADIVKANRKNKIQAELNKHRKKINKLKALGTTPKTRALIKSLEFKRTNIILRYFDKLE